MEVITRPVSRQRFPCIAAQSHPDPRNGSHYRAWHRTRHISIRHVCDVWWCCTILASNLYLDAIINMHCFYLSANPSLTDGCLQRSNCQWGSLRTSAFYMVKASAKHPPKYSKHRQTSLTCLISIILCSYLHLRTGRGRGRGRNDRRDSINIVQRGAALFIIKILRVIVLCNLQSINV